jgi:hypothetical protein
MAGGCHSIGLCRARACLPSLRHSPTIRRAQYFGGFMPSIYSRHFQFGLILATALSVSLFSTAGFAYTPRAATGLHRRCVSVLRRRDSRRRSGHGLHDPQQVPPVAGLPGLFPAGPRAERGLGYPRRQADQHQACSGAKTGQRQGQGQKTQKAGQAGHCVTA